MMKKSTYPTSFMPRLSHLLAFVCLCIAGFATPDSISEFYGYSSLTAFTMTIEGVGDGESGCIDGPGFETETFYSSTDPIAANTFIYDGNRNIFNGGNQWYYYPSGTKVLQIGEDGKVIDVYSCE